MPEMPRSCLFESSRIPVEESNSGAEIAVEHLRQNNRRLAETPVPCYRFITMKPTLDWLLVFVSIGAGPSFLAAAFELPQIVNLDQGYADGAILASHDRCKLTRWRQVGKQP